ncbi:hypothetical protein BLOT_010484 [Blomia tropicalis]|nr:hypothetical protein BLOT_010484 [Blomia tropicalis]
MTPLNRPLRAHDMVGRSSGHRQDRSSRLPINFSHQLYGKLRYQSDAVESLRNLETKILTIV